MFRALLSTLALTATLAMSQNESRQEVSDAQFLIMLNEEAWKIGVFFVTFGSLIAFFGTKCYHLSMSLIAFIFTLEAVIGVSLARGEMNHESDIMQRYCLAFMLGILVAGFTMVS